MCRNSLIACFRVFGCRRSHLIHTKFQKLYQRVRISVADSFSGKWKVYNFNFACSVGGYLRACIFLCEKIWVGKFVNWKINMGEVLQESDSPTPCKNWDSGRLTCFKNSCSVA